MLTALKALLEKKKTWTALITAAVFIGGKFGMDWDTETAMIVSSPFVVLGLGLLGEDWGKAKVAVEDAAADAKAKPAKKK